MSARRTWHKGPPPFVGWWSASTRRDKTVWRWWNGKCWSKAALEDDSAFVAAGFAKVLCPRLTPDIEWTDYYPESARVLRVAP